MSRKKGIDSGRHDNSYYDRERRVRRWFGEVIIICYQMPVLVEAWGFGHASTLLFEDSRRCFSCGVRELKWCFRFGFVKSECWVKLRLRCAVKRLFV